MGIIIATLIVLVAIASALAQDFAILSWAYWQEGGSGTSRSEVFRNVGLFLVAVIALGFGIWRSWTAHRQAEASQRQAEAANEQARIAQQGHITDRFSTAVEHLGSEQLPVRLGGIYALWRLIEDSPKRDVTTVIDILCAFVRDPPHPSADRLEADANEDGTALVDEANAANKLRPDVQTVLNLIGNEKGDYRTLLPDGYRLDLAGANLAGANLWHANLTRAHFKGANLTNANLAGVNLTDTRFWSASLTGTNLADANLMGADLSFANLTDAYLRDTNLKDASFVATILTGANLTGAENLIQKQLNIAFCDPNDPPKLPEGLTPLDMLPEPFAVGTHRRHPKRSNSPTTPL